MREIKFRAWDAKTKTMRQGVEFEALIPYIEHPDFTLMQYTGLKDKTGKEIYEDDLIRDGKLIRAVQYFPEWGAFQLVEGGGNCVNLIKGEDQEGGLEDYLVAEKIRVIGNIYENPNLL